MSEVVTTADVWVALQGVAGLLQEVCDKLSETRTEPRVAEPDPGLVAVLDQMNARLRNLSELVPTPAEVVVNAPPVDLSPLTEAIASMKQALAEIPDAVGKHFNIRVAGGSANLSGPVGLKNTGGTPIDPATTSNVTAVKTAVDQLKTVVQTMSDNLTTYTDGLEGHVDGLEALVTSVRDYLDTVETKLQSLIDGSPALTLTARMLARQPATGYALWFDTADEDHIYTLEAAVAKAANETGFRGIRVTKDANGNPLGKVEINESASLTFDNRTTDPGWS